MPRKKCHRNICFQPTAIYFKPAGVRMVELDELVIGMDELEAIRLADGLGLYHADAADRMQVSRQTFGRIIASARSKIALALTEGMAIRIERMKS